VTETFDDSQSFDSQGTASDVQHSRTQAASITEGQTEDSEIDTQTSDESGSALAYKVILWEGCVGTDSQGMTINLALWWLHMLAGQSNEIGDEYPALRDDIWNERLTKTLLIYRKWHVLPPLYLLVSSQKAVARE